MSSQCPDRRIVPSRIRARGLPSPNNPTIEVCRNEYAQFYIAKIEGAGFK